MPPTDINEICEDNCQDLDSRIAQNVVVGLLCRIADSVTQASILCAPDDGRPIVTVFTEGQETQFFEINGITPYDYEEEGLPINCGSQGYQIIEYLICDNGIQKIVQLTFLSGGLASTDYYLLNRTVSTAPADWTLVKPGECLASGIAPNYNQVNVTTTATVIKNADASRRSILIQNQSSTPMYIGFDAMVTTSTGLRLLENMSWFTTDYLGAVYGITASGSATTGYIEL